MQREAAEWPKWLMKIALSAFWMWWVQVPSAFDYHKQTRCIIVCLTGQSGGWKQHRQPFEYDEYRCHLPLITKTGHVAIFCVWQAKVVDENSIVSFLNVTSMGAVCLWLSQIDTLHYCVSDWPKWWMKTALSAFLNVTSTGVVYLWSPKMDMLHYSVSDRPKWWMSMAALSLWVWQESYAPGVTPLCWATGMMWRKLLSASSRTAGFTQGMWEQLLETGFK